jgi:hypothetical protein
MRSLVLGGIALCASATKIAVTNSPRTIPGYATTWTVDTDTGDYTRTSYAKFDSDALSSAVVCDNTYFAVYTSFATATFGITVVDLSSNSTTPTRFSTQSLFHSLACDPQSPSGLMGVASDSAGAPLINDPHSGAAPSGAGASFHLKRLGFDGSNETVVGTFPQDEVVWGGSDTIFAFKRDGSEIWASWPADNCPGCQGAKQGGRLHIMDTSSGAIKTSLQFKKTVLHMFNAPFFMVPDAMRGVFDYGTNGTPDLFWADLTLGSSSIEIKKGAAADHVWDSGQPSQNCGTNIVAGSSPQGVLATDTVYVIDPSDGSTVSQFDLTTIPLKLQKTPEFGAVACIE